MLVLLTKDARDMDETDADAWIMVRIILIMKLMQKILQSNIRFSICLYIQMTRCRLLLQFLPNML